MNQAISTDIEEALISQNQMNSTFKQIFILRLCFLHRQKPSNTMKIKDLNADIEILTYDTQQMAKSTHRLEIKEY